MRVNIRQRIESGENEKAAGNLMLAAASGITAGAGWLVAVLSRLVVGLQVLQA
jgi:hypothetical protein